MKLNLSSRDDSLIIYIQCNRISKNTVSMWWHSTCLSLHSIVTHGASVWDPTQVQILLYLWETSSRASRPNHQSCCMDSLFRTRNSFFSHLSPTNHLLPLGGDTSVCTHCSELQKLPPAFCVHAQKHSQSEHPSQHRHCNSMHCCISGSREWTDILRIRRCFGLYFPSCLWEDGWYNSEWENAGRSLKHCVKMQLQGLTTNTKPKTRNFNSNLAGGSNWKHFPYLHVQKPGFVYTAWNSLCPVQRTVTPTGGSEYSEKIKKILSLWSQPEPSLALSAQQTTQVFSYFPWTPNVLLESRPGATRKQNPKC